jgi:O-antigen/teichoic acid export membrane protein
MDASSVLGVLLVAGVASALGIVATSTLEAVGKQFISSIASIITIAMQLMLSIILIPNFGALGAAIALLSSTSMASLILMALVLKYLRETSVS